MGLFKNFLLERTARTNPPLAENNSTFYCRSYHENVCKSCSPTVEACEITDDYEPACFSVWRNSQEKEIVHMGCWSYHKVMRHCLFADRCVSNRPHDIPDYFGKDVFFCCCEQSMCNERSQYDPASYLTLNPNNAGNDLEAIGENFTRKEPVPLLTSGQKHLNQTAIEHRLNNVLYVSVPIFILALALLIAYFVYRRFRMKFLDDSVDSGHQGQRAYKGSMLIFRPTIKIIRPSKLLSKNKGGYRGTSGSNSATTVLVTKQPFSLGDIISRGRYGSVYVARYENDFIAVKVTQAEHKESYTVERDIYKLNALRQCENILRFLHVGDQMQSNDQFWLTTEYHSNGSVYDYLKSHKISFGELYHIARTMLNGLAFLHEEVLHADDDLAKPTIIHRDFKSKNVLLKRDLTAVVADFGLALKCYHGRTPDEKHVQVGTSRYMAPELLLSATEFSAFAFKQIDVYAASLVLWELLSRCVLDENIVDDYKLPYEEELGLNPSQFELREYVAKNGHRPVLKDRWLKYKPCAELCSTIFEMWDQDPEARLTVGCALERIQKLQCYHQAIFSTCESPLSAVISMSGDDITQPLIPQNRMLIALSTSNNR